MHTKQLTQKLIAKLKSMGEWENILKIEGGYDNSYWKEMLDPIFNKAMIHELDRQDLTNIIIQRAKEVFRKEATKENEEVESGSEKNEIKEIFTPEKIKRMEDEFPESNIGRIEAASKGDISGEEFRYGKLR